MNPDDDPEAPESNNDSETKFNSLLSLLNQSETAVLAFSGGVDSSFLLKAMTLAEMKCSIAVTARSGTMPSADFERALAMAAAAGSEHLVIETAELENEAFLRNSGDRCFHCKDELFSKLKAIAGERGCRYVFDGTNSDDLNDYRPGREAASRHGVRSPLAECGFSKEEIRSASRRLGLSTWDQPSSPCLSSRVPYGRRITIEALRRIEAAEAFLRTIGIDTVRVRDHGDTARIEVPEAEMPLLLDNSIRSTISARLKELGYSFVSIDLDGYRSGSMNRTIKSGQN